MIDSTDAIAGVIAVGNCGFYGAFESLEPGLPRASALQDVMEDVRDQECSPEELQLCTANGSHYCLLLEGGASCVVYADSAVDCPSGYSAVPTGDHPVMPGEQICAQTDEGDPEPVGDPPAVGPQIINDGMGLDIADGYPYFDYSGQPYDGATFNANGATSSESGGLSFFVRNWGPYDIEVNRGIVVISTSEPLLTGSGGIALSGPGNPHLILPDHVRVWVDGAWSADLGVQADPISVGSELRYFYASDYFSDVDPGTIIVMRASTQFNLEVYESTLSELP